MRKDKTIAVQTNKPVPLKSLIVVAAAIFVFLLLGLNLSRNPIRTLPLDIESEITIQRAFAGKPLSLLATDRSPVAEISSVYAGWPALHTLGHATLRLTGIPHAKIAANFMFWLMGVVLFTDAIRRLDPKFEWRYLFPFLLLNPVGIAQLTLGISHAIIPFGFAVAIWGAVFTWEKAMNVKNTLILVMAGFISGYSDWHSFALLPSLFCLLLIAIPLRKKNPSLPKAMIFTGACLSAGMFLAYGIHSGFRFEALGAEMVINTHLSSQDRLEARMAWNEKTLLLTPAMQLLRIALVALPMLFVFGVLRITSLTTIRTGVSPKVGVLLAWLILSCVAWSLIFPGQVAVPGHRFEMLMFVLPVALLSAFLSFTTNQRTNGPTDQRTNRLLLDY